MALSSIFSQMGCALALCGTNGEHMATVHRDGMSG